MADFDDSKFQEGMNRFGQRAAEAAIHALTDIGTELLRLSQVEVPHDTGHLQNSGETHREGDTVVVGYHTPYAARLHEHPEYNFQSGRKGKYLEDPLKQNLSIFRKFMMDRLRGAM